MNESQENYTHATGSTSCMRARLEKGLYNSARVSRRAVPGRWDFAVAVTPWLRPAGLSSAAPERRAAHEHTLEDSLGAAHDHPAAGVAMLRSLSI